MSGAGAAVVLEADTFSIPLNERLIVALDVPTVQEAWDIVEQLGDTIVFYKIGLQLQYSSDGSGLAFARELIRQGKKVFLDSKLLDIGQTVSATVRNVASMGVSFLTVHGTGQTVRAAVEGRGSSDLKILSVTVLTSLDAFDMRELGYECEVEELVLKRARQALEAGADGVIASGQEAGKIRQLAGDKLKIVTPGIRPDGSPFDDQKRAVTPRAAILAGADYLVVGRPILNSDKLRAKAEEILSEIATALNDRH